MAGEILKKRREDLGLDIHEIADLLKIKAAYLVSIENDKFAELPAPVYTTGYIRSYAKYLNVDAESIIQHYQKNLSQPKHTTIIPVAFSQKKTSRIYYFVILAVVALAIFLFGPRTLNKRLETSGVPPSARQIGLVPPSPVKQQPVKSEDLSTKQQLVGDKDLSTKRQPAGDTGLAAGEHNLEITATDTTWLSVRFGNGKTEEMLLRPGNSKGMRFSGKVTLKIGNAGGIRVRLDQKDLGVPGSPGQVISLSLPPDNAAPAVTSP